MLQLSSCCVVASADVVSIHSGTSKWRRSLFSGNSRCFGQREGILTEVTVSDVIVYFGGLRGGRRVLYIVSLSQEFCDSCQDPGEERSSRGFK